MTAVRESFPDANGVAFESVRAMLPKRVSDWGPAHRVHLSGGSRAKLVNELHAEIDYCQCCGITLRTPQFLWLEWHHLTHGAFRSDERTAGIMLCKKCHDAEATIGLARLLWCKWRHDQEHLCWLRLTIIFGRFLPTPEPPPAGAAFWPVGFETKARSA